LQHFRYPADLPDLRKCRPPEGNTREGSEQLCYRALRDDSCLSETY
jgi:hypothetical protein